MKTLAASAPLALFRTGNAISTAAYAKAAGPLANTGVYTSADVIFISAEGDRPTRFNPIETSPRGAYNNITQAITARARFIIDKSPDRQRPYNVGERQIAHYLISRGYVEVIPGEFWPAPGLREV